MQFAFLTVYPLIHSKWDHRSHNTGSLYVYQFNCFHGTNQRQNYMLEKCYEKLVSNLILGVFVAIYADYSRVDDRKSGHRKLNSLFETFLIQDTIIDRILLRTEFGIKT